MRKITVIAGIILCAIGIISNPIWLIALGIAVIILSSFLPDTPLPFFDQLSSKSPDQEWPTYRWLGVVGVANILIAVIATYNNINTIWPLPLWIAGIGFLMAAVIHHDQTLNANQIIQQKWQAFKTEGYKQPEVWFVALLTIIGAWLRINQLESLPPMHGDEGEMGIRAMQVLNSGEFLPPFSTSFLDHPTLFHYLQALTIQLFGPTISGLRASSILFGVLCIPAVYLAGRFGWNTLVGLIAAGFLTFSHVHIHFSRLGLNNIHSVFMGILLFIIVLWCQRSLKTEEGLQALTPWLSAGLVAGLAQYFYFGSRLFPFVLILWLAVIWFEARHTAGWPLWRKIALVPLGFLAGWIPLVPRFIQVPATFGSRQSGVSAFNSRNLAAILGEDPTTFDILAYQLQRNVRFFIDSGDTSSFYFSAAPGLGTVAAILFWVGLGLALARLNRFPNSLIVGWLILGVFLGGVLTNTAPAATRLVMIYPAIAIFCGIATDMMLSLLQLSSNQNRWPQLASAAILMVLMGVFGVQTYFQTYASNPPQSHMVKIGQAFADNSADADIFLLGEPIIFARHGSIVYLNQEKRPIDLSTADQLSEFERTQPNLFFVSVLPKQEELDQVRESYPGGELEQVEDPTGRVMFYTYRVAAP